MVAWNEIKPVLINLFASLAFDDDVFEADWAGRPSPYTSTEYRADLLLRVMSVRHVGVDERRRVRVPPDPSADPGSPEFTGYVVEAVVGQRVFTLRVDAIQDDDTDTDHASGMIERIATRLRRTRVSEILDTVEVGLNEIGDALDTTYAEKGRVRTRVTMDVLLNCVSSDDDPVAAGVLERIEWTSRVQDAGGEELPVPPNVQNEVTPPET